MGGMPDSGAVVTRVPTRSRTRTGSCAFAISHARPDRGAGPGSGRAIREEMGPEYLQAGYLRRWLWSTEQRLVRRGTVEPAEIDAWVERLRSGDRPGRPGRSGLPQRDGFRDIRGRALAPSTRRASLFSGDLVRVRRMRPSGHRRCPRYVRGVTGVIEAVRGRTPSRTSGRTRARSAGLRSGVRPPTTCSALRPRGGGPSASTCSRATSKRVTGSRIAVVGAGGVGGYFGVRLGRPAATCISSHEESTRAIRERGWSCAVCRATSLRIPRRLTGPRRWGQSMPCCSASSRTTPRTPFPPSRRWCRVTPRSCRSSTGSTTWTRRAAIGSEHVLGGAAYLFARVSAPGVVEHTGGPGVVAFGELDGRIQ